MLTAHGLAASRVRQQEGGTYSIISRRQGCRVWGHADSKALNWKPTGESQQRTTGCRRTGPRRSRRGRCAARWRRALRGPLPGGRHRRAAMRRQWRPAPPWSRCRACPPGSASSWPGAAAAHSVSGVGLFQASFCLPRRRFGIEPRRRRGRAQMTQTQLPPGKRGVHECTSVAVLLHDAGMRHACTVGWDVLLYAVGDTPSVTTSDETVQENLVHQTLRPSPGRPWPPH